MSCSSTPLSTPDSENPDSLPLTNPSDEEIVPETAFEHDDDPIEGYVSESDVFEPNGYLSRKRRLSSSVFDSAGVKKPKITQEIGDGGHGKWTESTLEILKIHFPKLFEWPCTTQSLVIVLLEVLNFTTAAATCPYFGFPPLMP